MPEPATPATTGAVALRPPRTARMLAITVLWGACFVAISWGRRDAPVMWYAALRALVAGGALLALARLRGHRSPSGPRTWLLVTALALVNVTLAFGAMFAATEGTATGVAAVLSNAQPLLIVLPAWALYGERPDAATVALMVLGLAGLALVAGGGGSGAALALLAAVGITAGTLLARQLDGVDIVAASAWHFVVGGLLLAGIAVAVEGAPRITWTPRFVGALLFLALLGTAVALSCGSRKRSVRPGGIEHLDAAGARVRRAVRRRAAWRAPQRKGADRRRRGGRGDRRGAGPPRTATDVARRCNGCGPHRGGRPDRAREPATGIRATVAR